MQEKQVVSLVESQLSSQGRYFINCLGDGHGKSGTPDIISMDSSGVLVGIECKRYGTQPVFTQLVHAARLLYSGARAVVAYEDFSIERIDKKILPVVYLAGSNVEETIENLFSFKVSRYETFEFVLGDK